MPLPFPEVHLHARSRKVKDSQRKLGVNYLVTVLNWLAVGERQPDVSAIRLGRKLNKAQWMVVKRLRPLIDSWNKQEFVGSAEMGRSAPKVESIEAELKRLEEVVKETQTRPTNYLAGCRDDLHNDDFLSGHPR